MKGSREPLGPPGHTENHHARSSEGRKYSLGKLDLMEHQWGWRIDIPMRLPVSLVISWLQDSLLRGADI